MIFTVHGLAVIIQPKRRGKGKKRKKKTPIAAGNKIKLFFPKKSNIFLPIPSIAL
jgi:hypothetical protein